MQPSPMAETSNCCCQVGRFFIFLMAVVVRLTIQALASKRHHTRAASLAIGAPSCRVLAEKGWASLQSLQLCGAMPPQPKT